MKAKRWSLGLLLVSAFVLPRSVWSQSQQEEMRVARETVLRLHPGQEIRLSVRPWGVLDGRVRLLSEDSLIVAAGGQQWSVLLPAIDTLWVRGTAERKGAITGAVVGGTITAGVFYLVADSYVRTVGEGGQGVTLTVGLVAAGVGAVAGGFGGGVLGGIVGMTIQRWERKYP